MINKAWAGGYDYPQQQVQQVSTKHFAHTVQRPKTWEQKAKDTVLFLGETWGWSVLLIVILFGGVFRKHLIPWVVSPKQQLKKWINS